MKSVKDIFVEETLAGDASSADLPIGVVDAWKRVIDYDAAMKKKFSYHAVMFKSKSFTPGHKGHMTKVNLTFEKMMSDHGLDPNETIKKLFNLYPPKYI